MDDHKSSLYKHDSRSMLYRCTHSERGSYSFLFACFFCPVDFQSCLEEQINPLASEQLLMRLVEKTWLYRFNEAPERDLFERERGPLKILPLLLDEAQKSVCFN